MGGSPCQFWSKAKCSKTAKLKREIDTEGEGWKLFQKFVEAKNNTNPTYFLYEITMEWLMRFKTLLVRNWVYNQS